MQWRASYLSVQAVLKPTIESLGDYLAMRLESIITNLEELMEYIGSHSQLHRLQSHACEYIRSLIINPRRACAARVTVVVLCVCLSVCLSTTILGLQATRRLMSETNIFSATRA